MDKKDGAKKRNNKLRHKKYVAKKDEKPADKPKKKMFEDALPSNWTKYEVRDQSDDECEAANFETLLDEPLSRDSHFKFKNEEDWSKTVDFHSQFKKYFTVDINLLNVGIACVPFTRRHGYDCPILKTLDEDPEKNLLKYKNYLNKRYPTTKATHKEKTKDTKTTESVTKESKSEQQPEPIVQIKTPDDETEPQINNDTIKNIIAPNQIINVHSNEQDKCVDEELDSLLRLEKTEKEEPEQIIDEDPLMETTATASKNVVSNTAEDLEQWLDDILDD